MKKTTIIILAVCIPCMMICVLILLMGGMFMSSRQQSELNGAGSMLHAEVSSAEESTSETVPASAAGETETAVTETEPQTEPEPTTEPGPVDYSNAGGGTTSANVFNGGFTATDGVNEYFRGNDGYLYYNVIGSPEAYLLMQNQFWYLNVQGEWLYFADQTNGCMAKIRTDGTDYQVLYPASVHEVNVSGNYIYFCSDTELLRMKTDGTDLETLVTGKIWFLNVVGQELYFCRIGDTRAMCRSNADGSGLETIIGSEVYDILVYGGYIYYCHGRDQRYLYARNRETGETVQITDNYTRWINTDGRHVYYTNFEGHTEAGVGYGNTMFRTSLDGTSNEKLFEAVVEGMCIQNGQLHYMNPDLEKNIYALY